MEDIKGIIAFTYFFILLGKMSYEDLIYRNIDLKDVILAGICSFCYLIKKQPDFLIKLSNVLLKSSVIDIFANISKINYREHKLFLLLFICFFYLIIYAIIKRKFPVYFADLCTILFTMNILINLNGVDPYGTVVIFLANWINFSFLYIIQAEKKIYTLPCVYTVFLSFSTLVISRIILEFVIIF